MQKKFAAPGGQGAKFKNTYEKMIKSLNLPKGAKDELGITGEQGMAPEDAEATEVAKNEDPDQSEDDAVVEERRRKIFEKQMLRELYSEGRYYIIPSFFKMLMYLKKQK